MPSAHYCRHKFNKANNVITLNDQIHEGVIRVIFDEEHSNRIGIPNKNTPPLLRPFPTRPTISTDIQIGIEPPTPEERSPKSPNRPNNLIIPQLFIQHPSPTNERVPAKFLGSPPPQRSNINDIKIFVTSETPEEQETQKM